MLRRMNMLLSDKDLLELNDAGYLKGVQKWIKDQAPTILPNNISAGINLTGLSPDIVKVFTAKRSADEALGTMKKVMNWEQQNVQLPIVEQTGSSEAYDDFAEPTSTNINLNLMYINQYRHSTSILAGDLAEKQYNTFNGLNYLDMLVTGAYEALAIKDNQIYFNGYIDSSANQLSVYGLLNNPDLSAYKPSTKTWDNMSFQELINFVSSMFQDLKNKAGNWVNNQTTMRWLIPSSKEAVLTSKLVDTTQGYGFFANYLKATFPNLEIVSCPELVGAYNNQDVTYLIAETMAGGNIPTIYGGFSERAYMSRIENRTTSTYQKISNGNAGAILNKPSHITRWNNV